MYIVVTPDIFNSLDFCVFKEGGKGKDGRRGKRMEGTDDVGVETEDPHE